MPIRASGRSACSTPGVQTAGPCAPGRPPSRHGCAEEAARPGAADQRPRARLHDGAFEGDLRRHRQLPAFYGSRHGAGHTATAYHPGGGEFANVASNWVMWLFKGDKKAGTMFVGAKCGLCTSSNWDAESKRAGEAVGVKASLAAHLPEIDRRRRDVVAHRRRFRGRSPRSRDVEAIQVHHLVQAATKSVRTAPGHPSLHTLLPGRAAASRNRTRGRRGLPST